MKTVNQLNFYLSNLNILNAKLYHFHWFVKGPHFFTLHTKFEELLKENQSLIDQTAERILAIGGKPYSTLSQYLSHSTICEESDAELTAVAMVLKTIADYQVLVSELKVALREAEEEGDAGTADFITQTLLSYQKTLWMLRAFAQN